MALRDSRCDDSAIGRIEAHLTWQLPQCRQKSINGYDTGFLLFLSPLPTIPETETADMAAKQNSEYQILQKTLPFVNIHDWNEMAIVIMIVEQHPQGSMDNSSKVRRRNNQLPIYAGKSGMFGKGFFTVCIMSMNISEHIA